MIEKTKKNILKFRLAFYLTLNYSFFIAELFCNFAVKYLFRCKRAVVSSMLVAVLGYNIDILSAWLTVNISPIHYQMVGELLANVQGFGSKAKRIISTNMIYELSGRLFRWFSFNN